MNLLMALIRFDFISSPRRLLTAMAALAFVMAAVMAVSAAHAEPSAAARYEFLSKVVSKARGPCRETDSRANCDLNGVAVNVVYDLESGLNQVSPDALAGFLRISAYQDQSWADTILEGSYRAEGRARVDRVEELFEGTNLVAYRISYSDRAWYTGKCDQLSPQAEPLLSSCNEGRIFEKSFVSTDLGFWIRDSYYPAEFH